MSDEVEEVTNEENTDENEEESEESEDWFLYPDKPKATIREKLRFKSVQN